MKWYWYVLGGAVLVLGGWYWYSEREKVLQSAARARQAKEEKRLFNLNSNGDESFRESSEKIQSESGE